MEYHQVEHRASMERKGDDVDISFLPAMPDTIRIQVDQVEATSTGISPSISIDKPKFGPMPNTQAADMTLGQMPCTCLLNKTWRMKQI